MNYLLAEHLQTYLGEVTSLPIEFESFIKRINDTYNQYAIEVKSLKNHIEVYKTELSELSERYHKIVDTAQEGIWMTDKDNRTIFINQNMCNLLQYLPQEIIGKPLSHFMREEDKLLIEHYKQSIASGSIHQFECYFKTKADELLLTNLSFSTVVNTQQQIIGCLAMVINISKRVQDASQLIKSKENLERKNEELKRKIKELGQLAYVASHDLQEPLRTTSSYIELLKQQYQEKLDEKAMKYLNFISASSERMNILINDLLDHARIGTNGQMELVDCNKILQDVIDDISIIIKNSGAEIISKTLPVIIGFPKELHLLFKNLIINAINFHQPGVNPIIKILIQKKDNIYNFIFSDNGIGIEKEHTERIFLIFQRLHTRSVYQATGIGLSHCKKIVELHNGTIWVDSIFGEGSEFIFTIPDLINS